MPYKEINVQQLEESKYPNGISAYCVCYNSEKTIDLALSSVRPYVDELIVINQGSTDSTGERAKKYADIYEERDKPLGFPEPDRQYAMNLCKNRWILIVDSDEVFTSPLMHFIKEQFIHQNKFDGLRCQIISVFQDRLPRIEYFCKYVLVQKDFATIKPVLHSQIEGIKYGYDFKDGVVLHYQENSERQLKKLDTYDGVVNKLFTDGIIDEKYKLNCMGINETSRGQMLKGQINFEEKI
jgi:glycosyltransferase involved in cell wall biosynthesis